MTAFSVHMEAVARHLLGDPNAALSTKRELRYGTNGSLSVDLDKGTWYDHENQIGGGVLGLIEHTLKLNGGARKWLHDKLGIDLKSGTKQPIAIYPYEDERGQLLFEVVRFEPKTFQQRRPDGRGGWIWKLGGVRRVPFHLQRLLEANGRTIHIVEGEKDVLTSERLGLVATCNPGGAGKWLPEFAQYFAAADVVVITDNDEPGRNHANQVIGMLRGVTNRVRIVTLPSPAKDFTEWVTKHGGSAEALATLAAPKPNGAERARKNANIGTAADLQTMKFDPIKFIVHGYIAEGCTLLAGRPKLGKSWMMLEISLAVAIGGHCLGGISCDAGDVLYLALEDNKRRLQQRITKLLGAFTGDWPTRFHYATEWPRADASGLDLIREWIASVTSPRLVIVDVLAMFRAPRGDKQSSYEADYEAIQALQQIASDTPGLAIVIVHHLRKSGAETDPFEKVSGTMGLTGGADTVLVLDSDGNGKTLYGRGRDIEEIETAVEFDRATCRWRILGEAAEVRRTDERSTILGVLRDAKEPMGPAEIADVTGMDRNNVKQLLFKMMKDGQVSKTKRGKYVHPGNHDNQ